MRIECPHCDKVSAAKIVELGDQAVVFECSACQREVVANDWVVAKTHETRVETGSLCPKCGAGNADSARACRSCGLAADRFSDFTKAQPSFDQRLEQAWSELSENWQDDDLHESFLAEVVRSSDYKEAARRYRVAADEVGQAAKAKQVLLRIQRMASAALLSSRPKVAPEPEPFRAVVMLLIALVVLAGAGGVYVMMKRADVPVVEPHPKTVPTSVPPAPLRKRQPPGMPISPPQGGNLR